MSTTNPEFDAIPGYFTGMKTHWADTVEYVGATGNFTVPSDSYVRPQALYEAPVRQCDYCGVGVKDSERVTCQQCGAPLPIEQHARQNDGYSKLLKSACTKFEEAKVELLADHPDRNKLESLLTEARQLKEFACAMRRGG